MAAVYSGLGRRRTVTSVMTPSVPSLPIMSLVRSYPAADLRALTAEGGSKGETSTAQYLSRASLDNRQDNPHASTTFVMPSVCVPCASPHDLPIGQDDGEGKDVVPHGAVLDGGGA